MLHEAVCHPYPRAMLIFSVLGNSIIFKCEGILTPKIESYSSDQKGKEAMTSFENVLTLYCTCIIHSSSESLSGQWQLKVYHLFINSFISESFIKYLICNQHCAQACENIKERGNTLELRIYLDKNKILARIIGNLRHYLIKNKILCHRHIRKGKDPEKRVDQESLERSLLSVQNGSLLWA